MLSYVDYILKETMTVDYNYIENNQEKIYKFDTRQISKTEKEVPSYLYPINEIILLKGDQILDFIDDYGINKNSILGIEVFI